MTISSDSPTKEMIMQNKISAGADFSKQMLQNITLAAIFLIVFGLFSSVGGFLKGNIISWQDYVLLVTPVVVFILGLTSLVLLRRGKPLQGSSLVFITNLMLPIVAILLQTGLGWAVFVYALTSSIMLIWQVMPKVTRNWTFILAALTLALIAATEWFNPSIRIAAGDELSTFFYSASAILVIVFLFQSMRQAWGGNIRVKLVTSFTGIALISVALVGTVVYISYRNQVREDIRQRLLNIVTITAMRLDGDLHATLQTPQDMQTEAYRQMMAEGDEIIATDPDLIFSYTMRLNEQSQIYFILDSRRADDTERVAIGTIYDEPSQTLQDFFKAPDRPIVEEEIYTDKYGSVLSAFAPFYRADGSLEGIFGIDIAADKVLGQERAVLYLVIGTTLATMTIVALLGLWLGNLFVSPIINLSRVTQKVIDGDLSARADIETTDEVGELAKDFNLMTAQLQETLHGLEQRIADRTRNLELAAEVGRTVSQVRALDIMMTDAAELIQKQFDLYYVQVYLTDPSQSYLNLKAGTGQVGKQLLERSHRLPFNADSINGRAAVGKKSVVISDTTSSATFKPNPLLPDTRSEMAVPLMLGDKVVGVLDMQSEHAGSLSQDILPAFEALAGQLAIAIQNATFLAETEQARTEVEAQARRLSRANWADYLDAIHKPEQAGFIFEQNKIAPLAQSNEPLTEGALVAPITVTGEMLGNLTVKMEGRSSIARAEELVNTVARQVAQQIENLRLLDSAERYRAEAEQASRRLTHEGWQDYLDQNSVNGLGYVYDLKEVRTCTEEESSRVQESALSLPLKVRDETVGKLSVQGLGSGDEEAASLASAVAERLGAHIEGLRLSLQTEQALATTQKQARREQALRQITSAVRGSTDPSVILRTAARELGNILGRQTIVRLATAKETQTNQADRPADIAGEAVANESVSPAESPKADGGNE
jgi:GAF domain-containing protein/HAMP domain-containing protein